MERLAILFTTLPPFAEGYRKAGILSGIRCLHESEQTPGTHHTGTTVGHKWKSHAGQRQDIQCAQHIKHHLHHQYGCGSAGTDGIEAAAAHMAAALGLKTKPVSRRARFKSVVTLIIDGKIQMFEGTLEGEIARVKSGNGGFGYDPIFIADEYPGMTLADITEEQKNDISHRGKALRAMAAWLKDNA